MPNNTTDATLTFWSQPGVCDHDAALAKAGGKPLALSADGRFYRGRLNIPADGSLVMQITSPRPLRMWIESALVLDESLSWRLFNRRVYAAVVVPVKTGELNLLVEVGPRSRHPQHIDHDCPSRNRDHLMKQLETVIPDVLELMTGVVAGQMATPASLRFTPTQFQQDGVVYQQAMVRPLAHLFAPPSIRQMNVLSSLDDTLKLFGSIMPNHAIEKTCDKDRLAGQRRFYIPVACEFNAPQPLRATGTDNRLEPAHEIARAIDLTVQGPGGSVTLPMPAFESTGRLAPRKEYRPVVFPTAEALKKTVPQPVLPEKYAHFVRLYDAAWQMFLQLTRSPDPQCGVISPYVATGAGFGLYQFVWDSSFTAMCLAYGWRAIDPCINLDNLYSRQFDGGYIHREHWWEDGLPHLYEPDFGPNPPMMSVAEMQIARLTGNMLRIQRVYGALKAQHQWACKYRQLPDGTFWTTGLANGLDNSPSLGEGYPCFSAQMAHEAEILGEFAKLLGIDQDADYFRQEHGKLAKAINAHLWNDSMQIYSTSLAGGGHNPNKVVTAFWPLWAGVVPAQRVEALAKHLKDPRNFWRHHPIPSLAADSPYFKPAGDYWRGSTWAPTNYAAIKGFDRAGRHDLAVETTIRHIQCMFEVYEQTGQIWENYCSESSLRGNWSGSPYCWSALGPVALLLEVLIGVQPNALNRSIRWIVPDESGMGVRNYPLGPATVSLIRNLTDGKPQVEIQTDLPITVELDHAGKQTKLDCPAGVTRQRLTV